MTLSSIKGIALTKLDVLDGFEEIKICTGYSLNGKTINYLPSAEKQQKQVKPIYELVKGWNTSIVGVKNLNDLPKAAKIYLKRIEKLIGCPIILISTSPERSDTIYIRKIEELVGCPVILVSTSPERSDTIYIKDPFSSN